jgi:hypothetical protein
MDKTPDQKLISAFQENKCWMIQPLAERMNYSIPLVRRFLTKTGYFSIQLDFVVIGIFLIY